MDIAPPGTQVFSFVGDVVGRLPKSGVGEGVLCSHVGVVEGAGVGPGEGSPVVGGLDGGSEAAAMGILDGSTERLGSWVVGGKVGVKDGLIDKDGAGVSGGPRGTGAEVMGGKLGAWLTDGAGVGRQEISEVGAKVVPIKVGACVLQPLEPLEPLLPLVPFDPLQPFDPFDPLEP